MFTWKYISFGKIFSVFFDLRCILSSFIYIVKLILMFSEGNICFKVSFVFGNKNAIVS